MKNAQLAKAMQRISRAIPEKERRATIDDFTPRIEQIYAKSRAFGKNSGKVFNALVDKITERVEYEKSRGKATTFDLQNSLYEIYIRCLNAMEISRNSSIPARYVRFAVDRAIELDRYNDLINALPRRKKLVFSPLFDEKSSGRLFRIIKDVVEGKKYDQEAVKTLLKELEEAFEDKLDLAIQILFYSGLPIKKVLEILIENATEVDSKKLREYMQGFKDSSGNGWETRAEAVTKQNAEMTLNQALGPLGILVLPDEINGGYVVSIATEVGIIKNSQWIHIYVVEDERYLNGPDGHALGFFSYDSGFAYVNRKGYGTRIEKESEWYTITQHELEHGFDAIVGMGNTEYTPLLAGLVFCRNNAEFNSEMMSVYIRASSDAYPRTRCSNDADQIIYELHMMEQEYVKAHGEIEEEEIVKIEWEHARKLFDAAYIRATGLTYDQILEPFQK